MRIVSQLIFCIALIILTVVVAYSFFSSRAKVTLRIIEEDGTPVESAQVGIGFQYNGKQGTDYNEFSGFTRSDGLFPAASTTNGHIGWSVEKKGYYESRGSYDYKRDNGNVWEPWNPVIDITLRKIENPVPMYARHTKYSSVEIPVTDEDVGFDLIEFDWVAPYGKGSISDFVFHLQRRVVDKRNFDATLTLTFSNPYDGILPHKEDLEGGSVFKLPRYAPQDGYQDKMLLREWRKPDDYNVKRNFDFISRDLSYFFRIRSEDIDGKLDRSMYGKILGYIDFTAVHSNTAKVYFKYYLNPDYTRNLEFDPEKNLFKGLPDRERVWIK